MGNRVPATVLWALVILILAGVLFSLPLVRAADPSYSVSGFVRQSTGFGAAAGVTVDLISSATHQILTAKTAIGGGYSFTTASTGGALIPGWWGLYVPNQAFVTSSQCVPYCAALSRSSTATYYYLNASALTKGFIAAPITYVDTPTYSSTLAGTVLSGGTGIAGAQLLLVAAGWNSFVLNNQTTNATGGYSIAAPKGTWQVQAMIPGAPGSFNISQVTIGAGKKTFNPSINLFLVSGSMLSSVTGGPLPNGGNATLIDETNGLAWSVATPPGGSYALGAYGAGFGTGAQSFTVILSGVGFGTVSFPVTVSGGSPSISKDVTLPAINPPATYLTTLNFSTGFNKLAVNTTAKLGNYSTFPNLANASVGQLWAQLGLVFQHTLSFNPTLPTGLAAVTAWIKGHGPTFPADQAGLTINKTTYTQPGSPPSNAFSLTSTCTSGTCGPATGGSLTYTWVQSYNSSSGVPSGLGSYLLSFPFRHPTHAEAYNYSVILPVGYALKGNAPAPPGSTIVAAGPLVSGAHTYTRFILQSLSYNTTSSIANLTINKYSARPVANVNVTSSNFAFSRLNILDSSHSNYSALVGTGVNITFSGQNSTYEPGTSGIWYSFNFGDSGTSASSSTVAYHTYASPGVYHGILNVTASSGLQNQTTFTVYVGSGTPTAVISTNATAAQTFKAGGGQTYYMINWSRTLSFNAAQSTSSTGVGVKGVISVSNWAFTSNGFAPTPNNLSAGTGANPLGNVSRQFLGAGAYLSTTSVNGTVVNYFGWRYAVILTVFDYAGHPASATATVLVRDAEKPIAAATVLDLKGRPVNSVIEGSDRLAHLQLSAANSSDPHNGSIVTYNWSVTNSANLSAGQGPFIKTSSAPFPVTLAPQGKPYTVSLTVVDRAGNKATATVSLTVGVNITTRPVLTSGNLTLVPSSHTLTDGSGVTIWVNVTNTGGTASVGQFVQVTFYILSPLGSGSRIAVGGSPATVTFFNFTSAGVVNTVPFATGSVTLGFNKTVRAQVHWTPARSGNFNLYANATASNEFVTYYGPNVAGPIGITINQSPTVLAEEYGGIAAGAVAVILALIFFYRRRRSGGTFFRSTTKTTTTRAGLERGLGKGEDEEDEE
jgi:hypothetical protein